VQRPLITIEGGKPKERLGLIPASIVCSVALVLPPRPRIYFVFFVNFLHNHVLATIRIALSLLGRRFSGVVIFLAYYLALGPMALLSRLSGGSAASGNSFFTDKGPEDSSRERFERQY
jgi:hypothetical protein